MNNLTYFDLISPPGLEQLVAEELSFLLNSAVYSIRPGCVSVELPQDVGYLLNMRMKTPTRILEKLAEFRVRDFPKLYHKVQRLSWEKFLWSDQIDNEIKVEASSKKSRLALKKRIISTVQQGIHKHYGLNKKNYNTSNKILNQSEEIENPTVWVRIVEDICSVSIDTSGERLHRRGLKKHIGAAPLRENLAACLLSELTRGLNDSCILLDPVAGSGTFLLEALPEEKSKRDFAFQSFPVWQMRETKGQGLQPLIKDSGPQVSKFVAIEKDLPSLQALRYNLSQVDNVNISKYIDDHVVMIHADSLDVSSKSEEVQKVMCWRVQEKKPLVMIANPPYGYRIKVQAAGGAQSFAQKLAAHMEDVFQPDRIGFLLPAEWEKSEKGGMKVKAKAKTALRWPRNWILQNRLYFANGGIPVVFYVWSRC